MADQQYTFSTDSIPTQQAPPQEFQFSNDTGVITQTPNFKGVLKGPPPGQGPDIGDVMPTGQQIGVPFANALGPLGATLGTALVPEAAPVSGPLGAAGGQQVANILRSFAPQYFSENGKAPGMGEQISKDLQAGGTEGVAQTLSAAAPNLKSAVANTVASLPSFKKAIQYQSDMDNYTAQMAKQKADFDAEVTRNTQAGMDAQTAKDEALAKLKSFGKSTAPHPPGIDNPKDIGDIVDKSLGKTVDLEKMEKLFNTANLRGILSEDTKNNLRTIGKAANDADERLANIPKTKEPTPIPVPEPPATIKNGNLFMRYGSGATAGALAGAFVGAPYEGAITGAAAQATMKFTSAQLAKIAADPSKTRALVALMNPDTTSGMAKLYQQGLLRGLRGEEVYMTGSDGKQQKVKISDQGVPQLPQNPTNAPSGQSSKYEGQPPPPSPSTTELLEQTAGIQKPNAMGRFTHTPIYIDRNNMGIHDEATGYYYNQPNPKIVIRPTADTNYGEENRVSAHEQIHALLDKYGNPKPDAPNIRRLFDESDRAGNPDREIPAYMGAYKEGQVGFVTPQDRQDFVQKYIQGLPKPAQDVFNKLMKSVGAANQWE